MSINEDCLLHYLLKPDELSDLSSLLKAKNKKLENEFVIGNVFNKINIIKFKNKGV